MGEIILAGLAALLIYVWATGGSDFGTGDMMLNFSYFISGPLTSEQQSYVSQIQSAASAAGVDPNLAVALAVQESGLNATVVDPLGAVGIFQLEPSASSYFGVSDPSDPTQNINAGVAYLAQVLKQFGGNAAQAIAALSIGPTGLQNIVNEYGDDWASHVPQQTLTTIAQVNQVLGNPMTGTPA